MNILVCVKRVPATGAKIVLTEDEQEIETRHLGFTISPHEECAVEEAIRLKEAHGGTTTVLTLGPEAATEQLRFALAQGIDRAVLLETDGSDWGPAATAQAIVEAIRARPESFDLLLFGNESADSGGYQVGIRVAYAFDLPCVTGIKALEIKNGAAIVKREFPGGWEVYETLLPAAFMVKEGLNLPRYPSLPGRLRAKKAPIEQTKPPRRDDSLEKVRLRTPPEQDKGAEILGRGPEAAPKVVEVLKRVGVL